MECWASLEDEVRRNRQQNEDDIKFARSGKGIQNFWHQAIHSRANFALRSFFSPLSFVSPSASDLDWTTLPRQSWLLNIKSIETFKSVFSLPIKLGTQIVSGAH
jgi:hypothetical protein